MTEVRVTPLEPNVFGVEIEEGDTTTGHRVVAPPSFWDERGILDVDDLTAVRESVLFLLDRPPATAIPDELSLDDIARANDDYEEELRSRISA